jgi:hypothetical protein
VDKLVLGETEELQAVLISITSSHNHVVIDV